MEYIRIKYYPDADALDIRISDEKPDYGEEAGEERILHYTKEGKHRFFLRSGFSVKAFVKQKGFLEICEMGRWVDEWMWRAKGKRQRARGKRR